MFKKWSVLYIINKIGSGKIKVGSLIKEKDTLLVKYKCKIIYFELKQMLGKDIKIKIKGQNITHITPRKLKNNTPPTNGKI